MNREQSIATLRELFASQRFVEARDFSIDLTQRYPNDIEIWKARADLHFKLGERDFFGECSRQIIRLSDALLPSPAIIETYRFLGSRCAETGHTIDAINAYENLLAIDPFDAHAHACLGICLLRLGNFQQGWPEYDWRFKVKDFPDKPSTMPRWRGQPLHGKTILVKAEQGYGDTVQFVRYLRNVKARGGTIILKCPLALRRLLAGCTSVDHIICQGDLVPPHNIEATLLSLPGIFQTSLDTIPADVPYLRVPQSAGAQAVPMIIPYTGVLRVGLVWAGSIQNPRDHGRSLKLEQFSDLFRIASTKFFSLQKGDAATEIKSIPLDLITDLSPYLGDFADTAAAIQALDLIISVDTAVAHVAGSLARPVWTLIPFVPDWRWMLNRDDSPWYPTMRLFRQPAPGDWSSVITRLAAQLTAIIQEQSTLDKKQRSPFGLRP